MRKAEDEGHKLKITKLKGGKYKVESSKKGKFYDVDLNVPSCSCPQFLFRERQSGGKCKHIKAAEEKYGRYGRIERKGKISSKTKKGKTDSSASQKTLKSSLKSSNKVLEEVRKKGEIETVVLMEKYGEDKVQDLIDTGELIESKGKVRLLE